MGKAGKVVGCFAVCSLMVSGSAFAQSAGDPDPGSPPGTVYELPVDDGRRDAAPPNAKGGGGGGGTGGGAPASSFRSENNFGTSSVVPGDPRADGGKQGQAGGGGTAGGTGDAGGSGVVDPASVRDTGDTSSAQNYLLLALIAGGGLLLGVIAARTRAIAEPSG
jgi:hypothetical protein